MTPIKFEQSTDVFGPPKGLEETQVMSVAVYCGTVARGSVEGAPIRVTCWQPTDDERRAIAEGRPIFISFLGAHLPPHYPSTSFEEATNPQ